MVTVYNISPFPVVLDWGQPAVKPGGSVEVTPEVAATLSPTYWSELAPKARAAAPVAPEQPDPPSKTHKPSAPPKPADDAPKADDSATEEDK